MEFLPFLLLTMAVALLLCAGVALGGKMAMKVSSKEICRRHNKFHKKTS
jgi:hypothetical protein